ncbi:MAG: hypothetical protein AAFY19_06460 [Pseudomonadota bacterium]
MTEQDQDTQTVETVTEARQGVRKKGMPKVLFISTLVAAAGLALILAFYAI